MSNSSEINLTNSSTANWRNLIAACAAITVFGFALGLTYPLLSLILESRGVSSDMIGINGAMMPIGILLFSSMIPVLAKRFGARNVAILAAIITAVLLLSYKVFDSLAAWFLIRMLQGMSISTLFVLSEAWVVEYSGSRNRGKIIAIYGAILSASFGAGPLLISFIGIEGWLPFACGGIVLFLGVIPLFFIQEENTSDPEEVMVSGLFSFAPKAPMLLACVGIFAIFDAATLALFPVYGIKIGLDLETATNLLTVLILGNVFLQFPIGWLADKFPHRKVLFGCALVTTILLLLFPFMVNTLLMWPALVIMGAAAYGIYTISLVSLGGRFSGIELINGTSAFAVMWGIGALVGSVSGGWVMLGFGPHGLPVSLGLAFAVLAVGLYQRIKTQ